MLSETQVAQRGGTFLHVCAVCDRPFYGPRTVLFCGLHRGRRPNHRCVVCGVRVRGARFLCVGCVRERNLRAKARWERSVRRSADKREVALREPFYGLQGEVEG